ncbi:hypothetical protein N7449_009439 [Penicillium cf. viridicatum]|uniref:Uncharacterized protein n=1 Tax=Penicillium cf. viridicatum TaxID=2972119 RepID=A0A9W9MAN2_9EURO|nr:hypothetical protein N7449_009439 [Penicillium cf. viridicatum]
MAGHFKSGRRTRAVCVDITKRRQRPYYFVSEEEFQDIQTIMKSDLPDEVDRSVKLSLVSVSGQSRRHIASL